MIRGRGSIVLGEKNSSNVVKKQDASIGPG